MKNQLNRWTSPKREDIELNAGPAPAEAPMEARIARLESDVAHLRSDVADIKTDVRALRDKGDGHAVRLDAKIDALGTRLDEKIDGLGARLDAKIDGLGAKLDANIDNLGTKLDAKFSSSLFWALGACGALAAAIFGTMARGFGWI